GGRGARPQRLCQSGRVQPRRQTVSVRVGGLHGPRLGHPFGSGEGGQRTGAGGEVSARSTSLPSPLCGRGVGGEGGDRAPRWRVGLTLARRAGEGKSQPLSPSGERGSQILSDVRAAAVPGKILLA